MSNALDQSLPAILWRLSRLALDELRSHESSGELHLTAAPYVRTVVTNFTYDKGTKQLGRRQETIVRQYWDVGAQVAFIESRVKPRPEYQVAAEAIARRQPVSLEQAYVLLDRYLQLLVGELRSDPSDSTIAGAVVTFAQDLDGAPVEWKVYAPLDGVWLEVDKIGLATNCLIRRPLASDYESEVAYGRPQTRIPGFDLFSGVLELSTRDKDGIGVQRETEAVLDVLRLFRLGSVVARNTQLAARSYSRFGGTMGYPIGQTVVIYRYGIGAHDASALAEFYERFLPEVSTYSTFGGSAVTGDPLGIALQRYKDALFMAGATEARITSAITCLEALFLKAEERAELSHRLGQRASMLIQPWAGRPIEIYSRIVQAYDIRSTFIHGAPIPTDRQGAAPALCEQVLDFARLALLAFLDLHRQLGDKFDKDKLLSRLDNAMLDEAARKKLAETLGQLHSAKRTNRDANTDSGELTV